MTPVRQQGAAGRATRAGLAAIALALPLPAAAVDLVAAYASAQQHDPTFAAALAEADAGAARGRQGRALTLPTVTVSGTLGYGAATQTMSGAQFSAPGFGTVDGAEFRTDIGGGTATGWRVTLEQPLYNAERAAGARQLELMATGADVTLRRARQDLMMRTARAYFDVVEAEDALADLAQQRAAVARMLAATTASYDEGKLPITDSQEARARYDGIVAKASAARDALDLARAAFAELTGLSAANMRHASAEAQVRPFAASPLDEWLRRAGDGNPSVAQKMIARDIAAQDVAKWSAQAAPTLSLVVQAGGDRLSGSGGFGTASTVTASNSVVGLQLAVPLYTGGMRSARADEAVALAEKARYEVEAARKAVALETRGAWLGATGGLLRIDASRQAVASARARLDATETGHEVGARTTLDVLNAQADVLRAVRELAQAKHQVLLHRLALARAAGELSESDLRATDASLAGE